MLTLLAVAVAFAAVCLITPLGQGPLRMLGALAPFMELPWNIADTFRSQQYADRLNQLREQGQEKLGGIGGTLRDEGFGVAGALHGRLSDTASQRYGGQARNLSRFAGDYFGGMSNEDKNAAFAEMQKVKQQALDRGETPQAAQALGEQFLNKRYMQGAKVGEGGMTGAVKGYGEELVGGVEEREKARREEFEGGLDVLTGEIRADFDSLREILGSEYSDIIDRTEARLEQIRGDSDLALEEARGLRGEALAELTRNTAYTIASQSSMVAGDMQKALSALNQKYAGADMSNPSVQARYNQEKMAVESSFKGHMLNIVKDTEYKFSELVNTAHTDHAGIIGSLNASTIQTFGAAVGEVARAQSDAYRSYTVGLDNIYRTKTTGLTKVEDLRFASQELESVLMTGAETAVFAAVGSAFAFDTQMMQGFVDSMNSLEDQMAVDRTFADVTTANLVNSAWSQWGNAETNAASALINASFEFVPWANVSQSFNAGIMDYLNYNLDRKTVTAQQDAADAAQVGAYASLVPSLGFNIGGG